MSDRSLTINEQAAAQARARLLEIARQQGVGPLRVDELRGDFWPEEESTADFLAWLRTTREAGARPRRIPE